MLKERLRVSTISLRLRCIRSECRRAHRKKKKKKAYALHILNNQHEYTTIHNSMELIKPCKKGWHMNITENLYIPLYYKQHILIEEQNPVEENPLFRFITPTPPTPTTTEASTTGIPS
jgi:hypothetical protein